MRLGWGTDLHLDFVDDDAVRRLASEAGAAHDAIVISGDIASAEVLEAKLATFADAARVPVWFVLGNHDYYGSSIAEVRARMDRLGPRLTYLSHAPAPLVIAPDLALVGVDGWGDARLGAPERSRVVLNDFFQIADLSPHHGAELHRTLRELGDREAEALAPRLSAALAMCTTVLVVTHVPPFREACWHEGRISGDEWLPYFTCKAVGDVLRREARARPDARIVVVCGHTHGAGRAQIEPNLRVLTGAAEYGAPRIESLPSLGELTA